MKIISGGKDSKAWEETSISPMTGHLDGDIKLVTLSLNPEKFLADRLAVLLKEGTKIRVKRDWPECAWIEGEYRCQHWLSAEHERAETYPGVLYSMGGLEKHWMPILATTEVELA